MQGAASRGFRCTLDAVPHRRQASEPPEAQLSLRAPRAVVVTRPPPHSLARVAVLRLALSTHLSVLAHSDLYARSNVQRAISLENN